MSSILIEIITYVLGDAVVSRIPNPQPREGMFKGSLGAVSAFFGFVAVLFAIPTALNFAGPLPLVLVLTLVVAGVASLGILAGRSAPRVTKRNLALAKFGYGASVTALVASVLALLVALARALA
jgi:hypothetical protein